MAEFGWAYVAGGAITGAAGPTGSIQVKQTETGISGYSDLIWNNTQQTLNWRKYQLFCQYFSIFILW